MDLMCYLLIFLAVLGCGSLILAFGILFDRNVDKDDVTKFDFTYFKYEGKTTHLFYVFMILGLFLITISLINIFYLDCFGQPKKPVNTPDPPPPVIINITIVNELEKGIDTENYQTSRIPNDEKVKDQKGEYFLIDLKDAETKQRIFFDSGKYTKYELDRVLLNSLNAVRNEIFEQLEAGKVPYKVYVLGSADIKGNSNPFIADLIEKDSLTIKYLVKNPLDKDQYLPKYNTVSIPKKYANVHLPNLRAAYVQEKLNALDVSSEILDGDVQSVEGDIYRNAAIILYLPKTPNK